MRRLLPRFARPVAAALVLGVVAACALPTPSPPARDRAAGSSLHHVFAAGYGSIALRYLEPVSIGDISVEGLRGLGAIDPALTVLADGGAVAVSLGGREVGRRAAPAAADIDGWVSATVALIADAHAASPAIAEAPPERLYEAVFDGALAQLDVYSRYAGAEEARRNRANRVGYGGIGIRFRVGDDGARVTAVRARGPAAAAGIEVGDRIVEVAGRPLAGLTIEEVAETLRGPVGSHVALAIRRADAPAAIRVTAERAHIVPRTVSERRVGDVLVLAVHGFNQHTAHSLARSLVGAAGEPTLAGVVLDLRGNPGGLLKQAVKVADLFLDGGRIVAARGRHPDSVQFFEAGGHDFADGLPVVVLVDGKSASAAEIVAAALKERGRAVVVGTASYGKGTVQTVIPLPNDGELTLTWSRLLPPSGRALHGLGVIPAICTSGIDADAPDAVLRVLAATQAPAARADCPTERRRDGLEVEVARRLLADGALYGRLLSASPSLAAATR